MSLGTLDRFIRAVRTCNSVELDRGVESILRSPSDVMEQALIGLLKDGDAEVRSAVLTVLKRADWNDGTSAAALLNEQDPYLRAAGVEILARREGSEAVPALVARLWDEDPHVRNAACLALGELKDARSVDGLLQVLDDEESIAFSAIHALGQTGARKAIPHLWKAFTEREGALSLIACEVLLSLEDPDLSRNVLLVIRGWPEEKRDVYIRTMLEKHDARLLEELYGVLGEVLFSHLTRFIVSLSQRSLQLMRLLARFERRESCDFLLDVLSNTEPDHDDFDELVNRLAGLRDVWSSHVEEYLDKEPAQLLPFIRACAIAGQRLPEERLDAIFRAAPLELRREIIRRLPQVGDRKEGSLLSRALDDEDGHVKGDAALAAARMGLSSLAHRILELATTGFVDVRKKALLALVELDSASAERLVQSFVEHGSSEDKKVALSVVDRIDREQAFMAMRLLLADPDVSVLRSAIYAAGKLVDHDDRYLDPLNRFLTARPIYHELLRVIREHRLDTFKEQLRQLFLDERLDTWTRYEALAALAVFRDLGLADLFASGLRDENTLIKIGSIKALCDLSDRAAIPLIAPFASSEDAALRSVAEAALEQLKPAEKETSR